MREDQCLGWLGFFKCIESQIVKVGEDLWDHGVQTQHDKHCKPSATGRWMDLAISD